MTHYRWAIFIVHIRKVFLCLFIAIPLYEIKSNVIPPDKRFDKCVYENFSSIDFIHLYFEGILELDFTQLSTESDEEISSPYAQSYLNLLEQALIIESMDSFTNYALADQKKSLIDKLRNDVDALQIIQCTDSLSSYVLDYAYADRRSHYYSIRLDYMIEQARNEPWKRESLISFFRVVLHFLDEFYSSGLINLSRKNVQTIQHQLLEKMLNYFAHDQFSQEHKTLINQIFKVSRRGEVANNRVLLISDDARSSVLRTLLYQIAPLETVLYKSGNLEDQLEVVNQRNILRTKYFEIINSVEKRDGASKAPVGLNRTSISFFQGISHTYQYVSDETESQLIQHRKSDIDNHVNDIISEMDKALFDYNGEAGRLKKIDEIVSVMFGQIFSQLKFPLKSKLLIVPDGILCFFPFEILQDRGEFLIEKHEIMYDFKSHHNGETLVGNMHSVLGSFDGKYRLPKTKNETFEESLSFQEFENRATNNSILHVATHQVFKSEEPVILLSSRDSIYREDWYHIPDIMAALLSMCAGLRGRPISGEHTESFGMRAFENGAENVISSLWSVDDYSTGELIANYINNLGVGMNSSEGLRKAKLEYLQRTDAFHKHPVFWASFVHYGNDYKLIKNGLSFVWFCIPLLFSIICYLFNFKVRISC